MKRITFVVLILFFLMLSGCQYKENDKSLILYTTKEETESPISRDSQNKVRIALASVLSPQASLVKYKDLLDYIGSNMNISIEIIQKQSYQEVDRMLKTGEVDIAFICSLSYVLGLNGEYIVDVASPEINGRAFYNSYTIVHRNSPFESLEELEGKRFAYTDPYSYTGRLSILIQLYEKGYSINDFFGSTFFTYSHDYSINAVALGIVDGATVDGVLFDQLLEQKPELSQQIKIIGTGKEAGTPPIVASKKADLKIVELFTNFLLNLQNNEEGKKLLKELGVDKYIPINQKDYEAIQQGLFLLGET